MNDSHSQRTRSSRETSDENILQHVDAGTCRDSGRLGKMSAKAPTVKLNNGKLIPVVGLGTFQVKGEEGKEVIRAAIDAGYRHFDTALIYHSEKAVGEAVREKIADGTIKREDVFITSKLWCSYAHPGYVVKSCQNTLKNLGVDYVDLYLMHWPFSFKLAVPNPEEQKKDFGDARELLSIEGYFPRDASGKLIMSDVDYVEVWKDMEECVKAGLAKSIGISNFNSQQIERVLKVATIKPVVNEVEVHPYLNQKKLIQFCKERDIVTIAYSPLDGTPRPGLKHAAQDPVILKIAEAARKTPAQVILRYLVQSGTVVIPKTGNRKRLAENIAIFDFSLSPEQMREIDGLNMNQRKCIIPGTEHHKYYPFSCEF